jgi:hypothetical protein
MTSFPRLDVLPSAQRQLWPQLATVTDAAFVLYGGTAIALHLGHRESVDFDFFTDQTFQPEDLLVRDPDASDESSPHATCAAARRHTWCNDRRITARS